MKKENWSTVLAFNVGQAQRIVHMIGSSTLKVARERAKEIAQQQGARHYLVIPTTALS